MWLVSFKEVLSCDVFLIMTYCQVTCFFQWRIVTWRMSYNEVLSCDMFLTMTYCHVSCFLQWRIVMWRVSYHDILSCDVFLIMTSARQKRLAEHEKQLRPDEPPPYTPYPPTPYHSSSHSADQRGAKWFTLENRPVDGARNWVSPSVWQNTTTTNLFTETQCWVYL